ncbi:MAG: hypothetical protein OXU61_01595 [Gammaproteobacteria bacterium]|nr:hypothetical protein [Gammaproteobacteria bacterium]
MSSVRSITPENRGMLSVGDSPAMPNGSLLRCPAGMVAVPVAPAAPATPAVPVAPPGTVQLTSTSSGVAVGIRTWNWPLPDASSSRVNTNGRPPLLSERSSVVRGPIPSNSPSGNRRRSLSLRFRCCNLLSPPKSPLWRVPRPILDRSSEVIAIRWLGVTASHDTPACIAMASATPPVRLQTFA